VGLGHIAEVAVLPAFTHAARNSCVTSLVSGNARKRRQLAREYGIAHAYSYDQFEACLAGVDAVHIALPNAMHAEYTIRAARAGVHVLCEKPMALTVDECRDMIDACRRHRVKLMIAYRLRFETMTRAVIDLVRSGRIGDPRFFTASFSFTVGAGNIRTQKSLGGGGLYDIGVYCINAVRHLFQAEPREALALSVAGVAREPVDQSTGALLRFDGGRLASFVTSLDASGSGWYRIVGTKGDILVEPAFAYARGLAYQLTVAGHTTRRRSRAGDQFASELMHFSDCILSDREPEASGEDGMKDVRVIQALHQSAATGRAVPID
jgi:predicted dehydrogenase